MQSSDAATLTPGAVDQPRDGAEQIEVTVVLRPRPDMSSPSAGELGGIRPDLRAHLTRAQLASVRGAHPDDIAAVRSWAASQGLTSGSVSVETRTVRVSGAASAIASALSVALRQNQVAGASYRGLSGSIRLPPSLQTSVVAILGLDATPVARPHFRRLPLPDAGRPLAEAAPGSFSVAEVAELYRFPPGTSGSGACIGLIELGGGYTAADIDAYFQGVGSPAPVVNPVSVDGAANQPTGSPDGPDGEVVLDIEVAGAAAPGVALAVYFSPNTDQGFLDAINQAMHDQTNHPSVISISWGGPESSWPAATMTAFDNAFQDAALVGVTVCVAAGDSGSGDGVTDGLAHVDFPASSPHVLSCGGTSLRAQGQAIVAEVVWNDGPGGGATGGGISAFFPLPTWQDAAKVPDSVDPGHRPGRGVPDVAGDADPGTGYQVLVDGQAAVYGGTSAVAPLWAALLVRCAAALGRSPGYLNPILYQSLAAEQVTHDITEGNNGAYQAGPGWSACTGWGSPDGARLLAALRPTQP